MSSKVKSTCCFWLLKRVKELDAKLKVGALTLPIGFATTPTFQLLVRYLPKDKSLLEITAADLPNLPADALGQNAVDISGKGPAAILAELAHQMGAVFPGCTLSQAAALLSAQDDLLGYLASLDFQVDFLHCHYSTLLRQPTLILQLGQRGILCSPWTPDQPQELEALAGLGCYSIITNRPDVLKNYL